MVDTNVNRGWKVVPHIVKDEIITIAFRVIRLAEEGIHIPFYNIIEMKELLLKDLK